MEMVTGPVSRRVASAPLKSKLLQTIAGASIQLSSTDELTKFPYGKMKGKWVGITKQQIEELSK